MSILNKNSESESAYSIKDVFETYSPSLRTFISWQVSNRDDAEDILQEVFYQLARTVNKGNGEIERMSAWLYRVARNMILNFWRKQHEEPLSVFGVIDEEYACTGLSDELFSPSASEPDKIVLRKLVWQELEQALSELPPEQSEAFCLTVFEGMPVKEISAATGIPTATIASRKFYAVKFLRRRLKHLYDDLLNS